jgi:hypothetical protein
MYGLDGRMKLIDRKQAGCSNKWNIPYWLLVVLH